MGDTGLRPVVSGVAPETVASHPLRPGPITNGHLRSSGKFGGALNSTRGRGCYPIFSFATNAPSTLSANGSNSRSLSSLNLGCARKNF